MLTHYEIDHGFLNIACDIKIQVMYNYALKFAITYQTHYKHIFVIKNFYLFWFCLLLTM